MHAIWIGSINFFSINIPVKLYSGIGRHDVKLTFLHKKDHFPIRYVRVCSADGEKVAYKDMVKGYEHEKGNYIVFSTEDFEKAREKTSAPHTINIIEFTQEKYIDSCYFKKPYYLEPQKDSAKAYYLLIKALQESQKIAIAKITLHHREYIASIKSKENFLVLNLMRFNSELFPPKKINIPIAEINAQELSMAVELINKFTTIFAPEKFHDSYTEELEKIIKSREKNDYLNFKSEKDKIDLEPNTATQDLLSALKESLENYEKNK